MKNNETINILFCGTGGQGVLTAAEICGVAAMRDGYHVKKSEVHGMAQRGGSVESHLRFGKDVYSPLIPEGRADVLVSFDKGEHDRLKDFLKQGGKDLVDALHAAAQLPDRRYLNTFLLGVLSRDLPIREESWLAALEEAFAKKNFAANKEVFLKARCGK